MGAIYLHHKGKQLEYTERRLMIERGMTPPPVFKSAGSSTPGKEHLRQLQYHERQLMIEKGMVPPPIPEEKLGPEVYLRWGIVLFSLGIGFATVYVFGGGDIFGVAASIVGFLGAGYLVYYFLVRTRKGKSDQSMDTKDSIHAGS